jgi:LAS superfamily LD-carboxypeptidase LdcB
MKRSAADAGVIAARLGLPASATKPTSFDASCGGPVDREDPHRQRSAGVQQHHRRAIDIATPGTRPLTAEFDASAAFQWLQANAGAFGFHMPYGRGNRFGFEYEPWHWSRVETQERRRKSDARLG